MHLLAPVGVAKVIPSAQRQLLSLLSENVTQRGCYSCRVNHVDGFAPGLSGRVLLQNNKPQQVGGAGMMKC